MKTREGDHRNDWRAMLLMMLYLLPRIATAQVPGLGEGWTFPTTLDSWSFRDSTNWTSDNGYAPLSFTNISGAELQGDIGTRYALVVDMTNSSAARLQYKITETGG